MQAHLETLRTRIGQVADLRDAQGLREGQHMLATRLTEVEECISVHNVRELVRRIMRIESQIDSTGGVMGETIRNCLMRLDGQAADLEDLRDRMREHKNGIVICLSKKATMRYSKDLLVLKVRESMLKINQELKVVLLLDDEHEL